MKQLDTDTVLTIIKMIENGHNNLVGHLEKRDTNASDEYLQGTIRLMNDKNRVAEFKSGRLEYFNNKEWGSVCNSKFG